MCDRGNIPDTGQARRGNCHIGLADGDISGQRSAPRHRPREPQCPADRGAVEARIREHDTVEGNVDVSRIAACQADAPVHREAATARGVRAQVDIGAAVGQPDGGIDAFQCNAQVWCRQIGTRRLYRPAERAQTGRSAQHQINVSLPLQVARCDERPRQPQRHVGLDRHVELAVVAHQSCNRALRARRPPSGGVDAPALRRLGCVAIYVQRAIEVRHDARKVWHGHGEIHVCVVARHDALHGCTAAVGTRRIGVHGQTRRGLAQVTRCGEGAVYTRRKRRHIGQAHVEIKRHIGAGCQPLHKRPRAVGTGGGGVDHKALIGLAKLASGAQRAVHLRHQRLHVRNGQIEGDVERWRQRTVHGNSCVVGAGRVGLDLKPAVGLAQAARGTHRPRNLRRNRRDLRHGQFEPQIETRRQKPVDPRSRVKGPVRIGLQQPAFRRLAQAAIRVERPRDPLSELRQIGHARCKLQCSIGASCHAVQCQRDVIRTVRVYIHIPARAIFCGHTCQGHRPLVLGCHRCDVTQQQVYINAARA